MTEQLPDSVTEVVAPDPMAIADHQELSVDERDYIGAARAANTVRGYRSDWTEFATWCAHQNLEPLPAGPRTISGYLTVLRAQPPRRIRQLRPHPRRHRPRHRPPNPPPLPH